MAKERPMLAFARDIEHNETALHLLAQKPLDSCCQSPEHHFQKINPATGGSSLVKFLWETILFKTQSRSKIIKIISKPSQLLFVAAELEVMKIMPPSFIAMKNSEGLTASELFTKEHEELWKMAESEMKDTVEQCMLIATVIALGVFSVAISLPGGINKSTGKPNYLGKPVFLIFVLSDAAAFGSTTAAILIFFSILVSRHAVYDFYKSLLPLKLVWGLETLFFSVASMLLAFGSAFSITYYHYQGSMWVPNFVSVLAYLPAFLLISLRSSLWTKIMYSIYYLSDLFKLGKRMLYVLE